MTKVKRLEWFACYPEKWLAALASLKADAQHIYFIVCLRIYEKRAPIPDTIEALARRCGYRPSHTQRVIDTLCASGKLKHTADGCLTNDFCESEIAEANTHRRKDIGTDGKISPEIIEEKQRDEPLQLQLQSTEEERKKGRGATRGRRAPRQPMAEDWNPTEKGILYAKTECRFSDEKISVMVRACRDYHLKHGTLIAGDIGLAATWRTWCDNEIKFAKERGNGYRGQRSLQDDSKSVSGAATRLQEAIASSSGVVRFPPRPKLDATAGQDDRRLLPKG